MLHCHDCHCKKHKSPCRQKICCACPRGPQGPRGVKGATGGVNPAGLNYSDYLYWDVDEWKVGDQTVHLGTNAGKSPTDVNTVAIGTGAAISGQKADAVAIGRSAGAVDQEENTIAIGTDAGSNKQSASSIAIGKEAGVEHQGAGAIVIGRSAGNQNQGDDAIAIGAFAGQNSGGAQLRSVIMLDDNPAQVQLPLGIMLEFKMKPMQSRSGGLQVGADKKQQRLPLVTKLAICSREKMPSRLAQVREFIFKEKNPSLSVLIRLVAPAVKIRSPLVPTLSVVTHMEKTASPSTQKVPNHCLQ